MHFEVASCSYIKLIGLVWTNSGLLPTNNLHIDAGEVLNEIYLLTSRHKPLIIDCDGITAVIDHAWDTFFKSVGKVNKQIIFINHKRLIQKIQASKKEFCDHLKKDEGQYDDYFTIYDGDSFIKYSKDHIDEIQLEIQCKIKNYIFNSFEEFHDKQYHYLHSTPFLSTGVYNALNIIGDPEQFYWTTIALMHKIEMIVQEYKLGKNHKNKPLRLLSVSLRSSPFALILSMLLDLDVDIIDHFAPINKIYEHNILPKTGFEYIFIGDFCIGGTEIKITKQFSFWNQSILEHAVVIGSLFHTNSNEVYSQFKVHSIISLENLNPKAKYKIFK
jgi:hypothetical protein